MIPRPSGDRQSSHRGPEARSQPSQPLSEAESAQGASVRTILGDAARGSPWSDADDGRLGGRVPLRAETGAAVERELLLTAAPELASRPTGSGTHRTVLRALPWILMVGVLGSGVFFFVQARKTWESRVSGLEASLSRLEREGAEREETLRRTVAAKDREIAERKEDAGRIAQLADETLQQLKVALADFRTLREEKTRMEAEYVRVLQERKSPLLEIFGRWLPMWLRRTTQPPA